MLPDTTARALKEAVEATSECRTGAHVTLAVGVGGRQEVLDAIREVLYEQAATGTTLTELADTLTTDDIARHLYTAGQPDPDLVIRTSGEQRASNFLLWQTVASELYFCDAYWPAFREIDFLRALRCYFSLRSGAKPKRLPDTVDGWLGHVPRSGVDRAAAAREPVSGLG